MPEMNDKLKSGFLKAQEFVALHEAARKRLLDAEAAFEQDRSKANEWALRTADDSYDAKQTEAVNIIKSLLRLLNLLGVK